MPLFHVHGLIGATLSTLHTGGAVVVPAKFSAGAFWQHGGQVWRHLVLRGADDPSDSAGPGRSRQRPARRPALHPLVQRGPGAGRVSPTGRTLRRSGAGSLRHDRGCPSDGLQPVAARRRAKPGFVGQGTGVDIAILDEQGKFCRPASRAKSPSAATMSCTAISTTPRRTQRHSTNGYFRTGDQGVLDDHGYLMLTGRLKELINRGGEKISPLEVDAVLLEHPAVAEAVSFAAPGRQIRRRGPRGGRAQGGRRRPPRSRRFAASGWPTSRCPR